MIQEEAKKIMDNFIKALPETKGEIGFRRQQNMREEMPTKQENKVFAKRMLKNAPKTHDGCILAEKKKFT